MNTFYLHNLQLLAHSACEEPAYFVCVNNKEERCLIAISTDKYRPGSPRLFLRRCSLQFKLYNRVQFLEAIAGLRLIAANDFIMGSLSLRIK